MEPVFFAPALKLFNEMSPNHSYYHPHGKEEQLLPLFQWRWASVDHVLARTKGGANDIENYVTACWQCNLKYKNQLHKDGKPKPSEINDKIKKLKWDGLSSLYIKIFEGKDEWTKTLIS
ncbi:HNH endonuclease [Patescibacteria group bacterium]